MSTKAPARKNVEDIYPLSPMQQGMLFHSILEPDSATYHEQLYFILNGDLDLSAFKKALNALVDRHPVLRTAMVYKKRDKMLQVVHREVEFPLHILDWRDKSESDRREAFTQKLQNDRQDGFNLSKAPLARMTLIRYSEKSWQVLWSNHHVILDGWSNPILMAELFSLYEAHRKGTDIALPPARPYREYIAWLNKQDPQKAASFWKNLLQGFTEPTSVPADSPAGKTGEGEQACDTVETKLSAELNDKLKTLAQQNHLTINTLVQGAWALLLGNYSRSNDVVFGATVSGRPPVIPGVESMVGLFINTLPLRVKTSPADTVSSWLKKIQQQSVAMRDFEYSSLADVQRQSGIDSRQALFDSIVVFENFPVDKSLKEAKTSITVSDFDSYEQTNFPLVLVASSQDETMLELTYRRDMFQASGARRLLAQISTLLEKFAHNPEARVAEIDLLRKEERPLLLEEYNAAWPARPLAQNDAKALIENAAEKYAESNAVIFDGGSQKLSYKQLNRQANRLAHYLLQKGVGPESRVGLMFRRGPQMISAVWAVIKSGAAYVPLDSGYPAERLRYIAEDAGMSLLLCDNSEDADILDNAIAHVVDVNKLSTEDLPENDPDISVLPQQLVYMIYTSGSTGRPKGTLITHRGLLHYLSWTLQAYPLDQGCGSLLHSTIAFDATVTALFTPLLTGKAITLADQGDDLEALSKALLRQKDFSLVKITPAHMEMLGYQIPADKAAGLSNAFVIGGENLTSRQIEFWQKNAPGMHLFNEYGPTETVVGCVVYDAAGWQGRGSVPIGRAIPNSPVYVLDENLQPVAHGVPGELYISGTGVARGYHRRPALTAGRFVPDPFAQTSGSRMYRSGDLVRWQDDGQLVFLGRIDDQVKIRGYRIETGEIESILGGVDGIETCAVIARTNKAGDAYLAAYYVSATDKKEDALRAELKNVLPDYMLPAAFVKMDAIPLTANGKVDRRALPVPQIEGNAKTFVAPRNAAEELLATIWREILGVDRVGIHDNFFELGGHSLTATRLISRIRQSFEVELPLKDVFEASTIAQLAEIVERLRSSGKSTLPPIEPISREGDIPVSLPQQRLWFIDQFSPGNFAYNIPFAVKIDGKLDKEILEESFNRVIQRHEILRTRFVNRQGEPFQEIEDSLDFSLTVNDLSEEETAKRDDLVKNILREDARRTFSLDQLPLFKVQLIRLDKNIHILSAVMHHIISDGWSMNVLVHELMAQYSALKKEETNQLPALPIQYADYAAWQRNRLQGEVLEQQLSYWKDHIGLNPPVLELQGDYRRPAVQTFNGRNVDFELDATVTNAINAYCRKEGVTLFMLLLAAWQSLLRRYSGQEQVLVGSPVSGRQHGQTEELIGFFVNTILLKADFSEKPVFKQLLRQVRENVLNAYAHQDIPFEQLVDLLQPERDMAHPPLFQAAFILQNRPQTLAETAGLAFSPVEPDSAVAKVDISLYCAESDDRILARLEYNADIFKTETIERMRDHLLYFLRSALQKPDLPLARINMLPDDERRLLLQDWNDTERAFETGQTVPGRFEEWVEKQPQHPALSFNGVDRSYAEVNGNANRLAHYLREGGVGPESIVGICMERSFEMVEAMLAILKAGGAYLPLDPGYPDERLHYMIEDSGAQAVVTQRELADRLQKSACKVVVPDSSQMQSYKNENPDRMGGPEKLAYLIYTSGSTGKPKGTMLAQRGAINLASEQKKAFSIDTHSRILQFASLSFDAATWEMLMALMNGATLHLVERDVLASGDLLVKTLAEQKITTITLPPSVLAVWPEDARLPDLKTIITAGEKCPAELVKKWQPGRQFVNAYGPTETTVCASIYETSAQEENDPPIGKNLGNFELYVLDGNLELLPIGVPGELCVGGVGLSRGYLKRPALSAEKFIPNPFSEKEGARLYRTGDLVRRLADGNIEFLGRIDQQVKLRGFRIELGEIENAIRDKVPQIKDVLVMVRGEKESEKKLTAYIVAGNELDVPALRSNLGKVLPDYMIPAAFVQLDKMPLTPNGKIDRKALPEPGHDRSQLSREFVAPRNDYEKTVAAIIGELLNIERVGVHDNFFELGGHSLLATKFVSRVRDELGVELPLRALFENPTVEGVALALAGPEARRLDEDEPEIEAAERGDEDLSALLGELEGLSEEEVRALLDEEDENKEGDDKIDG